MAQHKLEFLVHVQGEQGLCSAELRRGLMTEGLAPCGCTIWNTGLLCHHHRTGEARGTGTIKGFDSEVKSLSFQLIAQNESHGPSQPHGDRAVSSLVCRGLEEGEL